MGATKDRLFPYYEELEDEFWSKHGRKPNAEESGKFWAKAEEMYQSDVDALRKEQREE